MAQPQNNDVAGPPLIALDDDENEVRIKSKYKRYLVEKDVVFKWDLSEFSETENTALSTLNQMSIDPSANSNNSGTAEDEKENIADNGISGIC